MLQLRIPGRGSVKQKKNRQLQSSCQIKALLTIYKTWGSAKALMPLHIRTARMAATSLEINKMPKSSQLVYCCDPSPQWDAIVTKSEIIFVRSTI
jgi:hypothetical protein